MYGNAKQNMYVYEKPQLDSLDCVFPALQQYITY